MASEFQVTLRESLPNYQNEADTPDSFGGLSSLSGRALPEDCGYALTTGIWHYAGNIIKAIEIISASKLEYAGTVEFLVIS